MAIGRAELTPIIPLVPEPRALLEAKERLRAAGPAGWRPNRLILVNYWLFDYEVFHFVQGRLLLRGANASGKTTVLVSAITLVLDGEKRRERLDTFGGQGRSLAYYLVGEPDAQPDGDFYFENRTGYVVLEFERARTGEHCTIGLGLRTSRSRPDLAVDSWGFVITDGRRVGLDLDLIDTTRQPLSPRQLAELLGAGGRVAERASDYRELVNRHLFGYPRLEQYEFLLELLHQLRSPKLNRDIKPSVLCELLTDSLPALPEGLLDQVTRVIRDIDECMESHEEATRQLQAVKELNSRYVHYLNQLAQLAAVDYQAALGRYREAAARHEEATGALARAQSQLGEERARLEALQVQIRQLRSRKAALEQHEALKGHEALRWLEEQLSKASEALKRSAGQAERSEQELDELTARLRAQEREWREQLDQIRERAAALGRRATQAAWDGGAQALEGLVRALEGRRALSPSDQELPVLPRLEAVMSELGSARRRALDGVLEALRGVRRAEEQHRQARVLEDRERDVLFDRGRDADRARGSLEAAREAADGSFDGWVGGLEGVEVRPEERAGVLDAIERYPADGFELSRLVSPVRAAFARASDRIGTRLREAELEKERLASRKAEVAGALGEWEKKEEAEPPSSPGQEEARRLLQEAGIPFVPLFAACEPRGELDAATGGRMEQALAEAGLLDALVTQADHTRRVGERLGQAGLAHRWLEPGPAGTGSTLWDVLQPDPALRDDPRWAAAIEAALRSVGWCADGLPRAAAVDHRDPGPELVVGRGGFRAGPLAGTAEPRSAPSYLGGENRRRTRQAEVDRLRGELQALERGLWEAEAAADRIRGELQVLEGKWRQGEDLAAWQALADAAHRLSRAEEEVREQQGRLDSASRGVREAFDALEAARAGLAAALSPIPEARGRDEDGVRLLVQETEQVMRDGVALDRDTAHNERLAAGCREVAGDRVKAASRLEEDRAALRAAREQVAELEGQVSARRDVLVRLGVSVEALLAEVRRLDFELASLEQEERRRLTRAGSLEAEVAYRRSQVAQIETARDQTTEAEARAREKFWERLQAYPSLRDALSRFEGSPDGPARAAEELLRLRRTADAHLRESVEESQREALRDLTLAVQDARVTLVELPAVFEGDRLYFKRRGLALQPYELESELTDERARDELILQEKETELYEQIILKDAGNEIRNRLEMAHRWRDDINEILREHPLVGGERLTLSWKPRPADRVTNDDPGRLVQLLQRDPETLADSEFNELVEYFRRRVNEVRRGFSDPENQVVFAQGLKDALDYRQWFRFHLMSGMPGESMKELTDARFASGSGGQKSLRMFVPLAAAACARYQGAAADAPRLIGLDEAFAGVDETNTREMFGLLDRLRFSWIMTSEKLWGDFATLPGGSVYELLREGSVVTPVWFVWDGSRLAGADGDGGGAATLAATAEAEPPRGGARDGAHSEAHDGSHGGVQNLPGGSGR